MHRVPAHSSLFVRSQEASTHHIMIGTLQALPVGQTLADPPQTVVYTPTGQHAGVGLPVAASGYYPCPPGARAIALR